MKTFLLSIAFAAAVSPAFAQRPPACTAAQISAATDPENGNFDAMSHGGTLLVLRNISPTPCTLPAYPALTFSDAANQPLPIARETPKGMRPGPAIRPVTIIPGAELTATLRWVSADVFTPPGQCLAAATVTIALGPTANQTAAFAATLCGPIGKVTYTSTNLAPDPVATPAKPTRFHS